MYNVVPAVSKILHAIFVLNIVRNNIIYNLYIILYNLCDSALSSLVGGYVYNARINRYLYMLKF